MRPEKNLITDWIKSKINLSPYVLIIDFTTLKVSEFTELRKRLLAVNAQCRVTKNTLLRRALKQLGLPDLGNSLTGQTAIVIGEHDVSAAAKILKNFIDEFKKLKIKCGILDAIIISQEQVLSIADLPSRETLRSKILGLLKAPSSKLVQVINTPAAQIVQIIKTKNG
jgi:large subunit ribosomal protein L10